MEYFLRTLPDNAPLGLYSFLHIVMLVIAFSGGVVIYKFRNHFKNNARLFTSVKYIFAFFIALVIISLYSWYIFGSYMGIKDGLPLYHCRVVMLIVVFYTLKPNNFLKTIIVTWGTFGVIIALLFPVTDPFDFPHLTFFTFFVGHIVLGWYIFLLLLVEDYKYTFLDFKVASFAMIGFNLFLIFVNYLLEANYGYLATPPILKSLLANVNNVFYTFIVFISYLVLTYFSYIFIKIFKKIFS